MRLKVLTVTAGMIIGVCLFACALPSPAQAGGIASPRAKGAPVCPLSTFLSKVHYLAQSPPFSLPNTGFANAPPIDQTTPVDPNGPIVSDLTTAFNTAPNFFKNQLCFLTGIYIDRTGCSSYDPSTCYGSTRGDRLWGFRAFDSSGKSAGEFIGTWLGLWQKGHAPVLSEFEQLRLRALLSWTSPSSNPPEILSADPDTIAMAVLAVLAHEVGHVFWYDAFVVKPAGDPNAGDPYPGGPADFTQFCPGQGTFYSPTGVGQGSWALPPLLPDQRWVSFGDPRNHHKADDVDMTRLVSDLAHGTYADAGDLLHGVYSGQMPNGTSAQNGRWASALAAFSTDEDFVETFQLYVLMQAQPPLQHLRVKISGSNSRTYLEDVPNPSTFSQKTELVRKSHCFDYLLP